MKSGSDNPTIGLLICKDKDQTEVQWAFQGIETPWESQLTIIYAYKK